ncbi:MAG TPA: hypothetical protein VE054_12290 [Blattabacteriaceae bacterium]|nr:hypothetical protein [Blattabacteriaceae bacterium]
MNRLWNMGVRILWAVTFCVMSLFPVRGMLQKKAEDAIYFQISTPKTKYRRGEKVIVSLTVVNRGAAPIYIAHGFVCGKLSGYVEFRILNSQGQNVENGGCAGSEFSVPLDRLKEEVTKSRAWLRLDPNEIYGEEEQLDLPRMNASYRLIAELMPPRFSEEQKRVLASEQIRVLSSRHSAPPLMIEIR